MNSTKPEIPRGTIPAVARAMNIPVQTAWTAWNRQDPKIVEQVERFMTEKRERERVTAQRLKNIEDMTRASNARQLTESEFAAIAAQ